MSAQILTPGNLNKPKVVSFPHLRDKLMPYTAGFKWGEDAIHDLWLAGAPSPQHSVCPLQPPCKAIECEHIKRILLPTQFKKWWAEVQQRMAHDPAIGALIHGKI